MEKYVVQCYQGQKIRSVWKEREGRWFFSVVDVLRALEVSANPSRYWSDFKRKLRQKTEKEEVLLADVGKVFMDVVHEYPDLTVHLTLFNASIREGTPQKLEHNDIRWIKVDEIDGYDFCPADEVILRKLKAIK